MENVAAMNVELLPGKVYLKMFIRQFGKGIPEGVPIWKPQGHRVGRKEHRQTLTGWL